MAKVQYKHEDGILHIGGGRFFYAQKPVEVSENEKDKLLKNYGDLEEVKVKEEVKEDKKETKKAKE